MVFTATPSPINRHSLARLILVMGLQIVAFWPAWVWYLHRTWHSPEEAVALLVAFALILALAWQAIRKNRQIFYFPVIPIALLMVLYGISYLFAPSIIRAAIAVSAILLTLYFAAFGRPPPAGFWGMVLLALPVLPSLQFYLGYPSRLLSASLTVPLLKMNGMQVSQEGTYLVWQNEMLLFDGPCSGITMLWAGLFLTLVIAFVSRMEVLRLSIGLFACCLLVLLGNVLRASSLFHLESGLVELPMSWWHEGVGTAAFILTAGAIVLTLNGINGWGKAKSTHV